MIDVLIIGSGGAGLTAALAAKRTSTQEGVGLGNASILVVGKAYPTNSQTSMAQGGMNAALGNVEDDHISAHIADTIKSAHGLCNEDSVRHMCADAPATIEWLDSLGVPFSRLDNNKSSIDTVAQRQMGGASAKRACYAQDYTGLKILHTLYDTCLKENIDFLDEYYLLNLILKEDTVKGATFLDIRTGEVIQINAKSVIMATGGYGSIYHGYTTNAYGSTGDGVAAVLRAGGAVSDMEFIQFHPTALKGSSILISESARGEGGYLVNSEGERFIDELKPRDEVARAIFAQLQNGNDIFLDVRHLGEEKLMELLPQEVELCKLHEHVDPAKELIPIKPVAHYTMGGIDVDYALEINGIKGCFAVGECSNAKVHGANRLGASSLMQGAGDGYFIAPYTVSNYLADEITNKVPSTDSPEFVEAENEAKAILDKFLNINGTQTASFFHKRLGHIMWQYAGMQRNEEGLKKAQVMITDLKKEFWSDLKIPGKTDEINQELEKASRVADFIDLAILIVNDALNRKESCGAHFREESMTEGGEAMRIDDKYSFVAAWEYQGEDKEPKLHKEDLKFENVEVKVRSYK